MQYSDTEVHEIVSWLAQERNIKQKHEFLKDSTFRRYGDTIVSENPRSQIR